MSSTITSGASAQTLLIAEGAQIGQGGILVKSGAVVATSANVNSLQVTGVPGASSSAILALQSAPLTPLLPQRYVLVNASGTAGGFDEGRLQLFTYDNNNFVTTLVDSQVPPRGAGAVLGTQAIFGLMSGAQAGIATIPLGAATIAVANNAITASSIVLVSGAGAPDATALSFNVVINAGVGFNITANAAATAAKAVSFFVVRY